MESAIKAQREIIFFLWKEGVSGGNIVERLANVFGDNALKKTAVYKWITQFNGGKGDTKDEPRSGRPRTSFTDDNVEKIRTVINTDRRISLREISVETNVNEFTVHEIVHSLGYKKLSARWIPRLLSDDQQMHRMEIAAQNLRKIHRGRNKFFKRLITVDETWLHQWTPETKEQSKQWCLSFEGPPVKAKIVPSAGKVMATVFWCEEGVLLFDFLEQGASINSEYYCNLLTKVDKTFRRRYPNIRPLLLQDNARPHTARSTLAKINNLDWDVLSHPPYSPDLAPSDFYLFPHMKKPFRGTRFETMDQVKAKYKRWCEEKDSEFFKAGIRELELRYQKCIACDGSYLEKLEFE